MKKTAPVLIGIIVTVWVVSGIALLGVFLLDKIGFLKMGGQLTSLPGWAFVLSTAALIISKVAMRDKPQQEPPSQQVHQHLQTNIPSFSTPSVYKPYATTIPTSVQAYTSLPKFNYRSKAAVDALTSFVALDLETTGLSPSTDKIIQIGAMKVDRKTGQMEEFFTYVNPGMSIPSFITELTGITNRDVADAPGFDEIAKELIAFLGTDTIFAHNASFDMKFLLHHFSRSGHTMPNHVACTVGMSKHFFPSLENYKLNTVASHLSIRQLAYHTATEDAKVCAQIALECLRLAEQGEKKPGSTDGLSKASRERRAFIEKSLKAKSLSAFDTYYLGLTMVEELMLEEGESYIRKAISMEPHEPIYYRWLSHALARQNRLDDALDELYRYRDSEYYRNWTPSSSIGTAKMIDTAIEDLESKKARGYVFRPRRKQLSV